MVEETGVPEENYRPVASHWQTLSHNVVLSTHRREWEEKYEQIVKDSYSSNKNCTVKSLVLSAEIYR